MSDRTSGVGRRLSELCKDSGYLLCVGNGIRVLYKNGVDILVRRLSLLGIFDVVFANTGNDLFNPFRLYKPEKCQNNLIQAFLMKIVAPWPDRPLVKARNWCDELWIQKTFSLLQVRIRSEGCEASCHARAGGLYGRLTSKASQQETEKVRQTK